MHVTNIEGARTELSDTEELRPLGALEHLCWLIDQERTMHFAVAAEVAGAPGLADWRKALHLAQLRHPMLSVRIEGRETGAPWLC